MHPLQSIIFKVAQSVNSIVYLVGDASSGEVLIVDACWDVDAILARLAADGMRPVACAITSNHFDRVGGRLPAPYSRYKVKIQGVIDILSAFPSLSVYVQPQDIDAFQAASGVDPTKIKATADGEELHIGAFSARFIHALGETAGSQCILFDGDRLLTGSVLLPGASERAPLDDAANAGLVYEGLRRISPTQPMQSIVIYPGHGHGGRLCSTMERELGGLPVLARAAQAPHGATAS